mgnify:CR=1 FL=1
MRSQAPSFEYLAGLFDGEGSIVISKRQYRLKHGGMAPWYTLVVCVANTHLPTIVLLREMFKTKHDRKVYRLGLSAKPRVHPQRECYQWHAASDIAEQFLRCLYPHLRIKKEEANLAFEFREHVCRHKSDHHRFVNSRDKWFGSDVYRAIHSEREAMYLKMKALKRPIFSGFDGMVANSGKLRCPARKGAEGQSRAKQEAVTLPGVCNEQVLPPKGKVCSELHRNVESTAEMTVPAPTGAGNRLTSIGCGSRSCADATCRT